MRSRPDLSLVIWPKAPRVGETLNYRIEVRGKSETPIDKLVVLFEGLEEEGGGEDTRHHQHVRLEDRWPALVLSNGEARQFEGHFEIPADAPASFHLDASRMRYWIRARVDIPWWPDRVVYWEIPVARAPIAREHRPNLFSTHPEGPRGRELTLEISFEDTVLVPGELISGAVAVSNVEHHDVYALEAQIIENLEWVGTRGGVNQFTSAPVTLCRGRPERDVPYPFRFELPRNLKPSIRGKLSNLVCRFEARARLRMESDVVLSPPLTVLDAESATSAAELPVEMRRAPPVGAERRALIWKEVATRCALTVNGVDETMSGGEGPISLQVRLEQRDGALWSVASFDWPDTGFDLALREKKWLDRLRGAEAMGDTKFDARFLCTGRDRHQLLALLGPDVRRALLPFERVTLDDDGAEVASAAGGAWRLESLEAFVRDATELLHRLAAQFPSLPMPPGLEGCRAAWEAAATRWEGKFRFGDCSILGAKYRGFPVELVTRFGDDAKPVAPVARVFLPPGADVESLSAEAQRVLDSVKAEVEGVKLEKDSIEATLPCPLPNPERAELLWRSLQRVAQALTQR